MQEKKKGVYALTGYHEGWYPQQLLQSCGVTPYMFHKVYGFDATMVGICHGEYPYLDRYLKGMNMDFLPDCKDESELLSSELEYLYKNFQKIDLLILYGTYPVYCRLVKEYKRLRPDGKIYIGLDANSSWMDRIIWTSTEVMQLLDSCDVIATSGRSMQRHLNKKWPYWKIEYIPNGFFNASSKKIDVGYEDKENIILTVGRIGSEQKANDILLEAFAKVHDEIPGWSVHLVGSIEDSFRPYIESYYEVYPGLKEKVAFKGLIESKEELYEEYKRAKIFILTSTWEGAPNVVGEALVHGCYTITSDIDAASDITCNDKIGRVFPRGDIDALCDIFKEVCNDENGLKRAMPKVISYAKSTFDWETLIKKLYHLLYEI